MNEDDYSDGYAAGKAQVSQRLTGGAGAPKGYRMQLSVTCRSCGGPFWAAKASALYCGSACRVRAFRARKGS